MKCKLAHVSIIFCSTITNRNMAIGEDVGLVEASVMIATTFPVDLYFCVVRTWSFYNTVAMGVARGRTKNY